MTQEELIEIAAALGEERDKLRDLANHLRHCRRCGELDVRDCFDGWSLWTACFPHHGRVEDGK